MKLSDVVYSITLREVLTQHMLSNPEFMKTFLSNTNAGNLSSMDLVVSPRSITLTRQEVQDLVATLRVMGEV